MPAYYSPTSNWIGSNSTGTTCSTNNTSSTTSTTAGNWNSHWRIYEDNPAPRSTTSTTAGNWNSHWRIYEDNPAPRVNHEELQRRDQTAYQKALREHDNQEAVRLRQQIADRERVIANQRRVAEDQRRAAEEAERQRLAHAQERTAAKTRAEELLLQHLTLQQQETYNRHGWFVVEGGRSKTKYRIRGSTLTANVDVLNEDNEILHRLCAHPRLEACPMGDQLLAQKMTLEYSEDDFLRVANRHAA